MGTDGLFYRREPSEQDDSVEDLICNTKGLSLSHKKQVDQPTDDLVQLLDSLKIKSQPKPRGQKTLKDEKIPPNKNVLSRRGPSPSGDTSNEPLFQVNTNPFSQYGWYPTKTEYAPFKHYGFKQYPWNEAAWRYKFAPGVDSGCSEWTKAAQSCELSTLRQKELKELSIRCQKKEQQIKLQSEDVPDGINFDPNDIETDEVPSLSQEVLDKVINMDNLTSKNQHEYSVGNQLNDIFQVIDKYGWRPESEIQSFSPPRTEIENEGLNILTQDENGNTAKVTSDSQQKTTKRPSSIPEGESESSPPKRTNIDAIYDKDIDEDNILHSMIIAKVPECVIYKVLEDLKLDGEDVLKKIINDQNHMLRTPLFLAVMEGRRDVVDLLLEYGADPNIQGKVISRMDQYELRAPLHVAAEMGDEYFDVLESLVEFEETNLDIRSESDRVTPLHIALQSHRIRNGVLPVKRCIKCIEKLVEEGVDTDEVDDRSSKTPLMLAIETQDLSIVKIFLNVDSSSQHADVMSKLQAMTRGGDTPLHIAAGVRMNSREKQRLLRILIRHGADANAKNNVNEVPKDIATNEIWKDIFKENFR